MKNSKKTAAATITLSFISIITAVFIQLSGQDKLDKGCSYLDPILIDILAFSAALFLIIEGIYKLVKNKNKPLKQQITRSLRVALASAILTLHIMQFIHK